MAGAGDWSPALCREVGLVAPKTPCSPRTGGPGPWRRALCQDTHPPQTLLLPPTSPAHVSGVPGRLSLGVGAWPLHIPRACPYSLALATASLLPNPRAHGRGGCSAKTGPASPYPPWFTPAERASAWFFPVLELRAHAVGATQASIDIFRERELFLR